MALAPSITARKTPKRLESFPYPVSPVLSGARESISSTKRKQVSQGIRWALSAIWFNILSESPTIPLLKSPAAFIKNNQNHIFNLPLVLSLILLQGHRTFLKISLICQFLEDHKIKYLLES